MNSSQENWTTELAVAFIYPVFLALVNNTLKLYTFWNYFFSLIILLSICTGKTATVTQVIKKIQSEMKPRKWPAFDYVDINGMRLTEPRQAYVQIYRQLTGKTMAWAQARDLLEARFTGTKKSSRSTILLVDELDIICNRKQDVVYNLFDWTSRKGSRLVAITIANTMDLPERVLKLKVASRLGLTRITFTPYSFKQLQEVVMARLAGSKCFMADAVQLVAR